MTEPTHLDITRAAYDTVAADYARMLRDDLEADPYDRAMLALFAEQVRAGGNRTVADVGCGPGRITAHLATLGLEAFGIDLSPGMIEVARRDHPQLRFTVGSMTDLDLPDGELGGLLAWFSTIHLPADQMPVACAELHRILAPGGRALLAFQVGDERLRREQAYGHRVTYDIYRRRPEQVEALLTAAGFTPLARLIREPDGMPAGTPPAAYLLVRKP